MRWDKGRDEIERVLSDGYLQRVPASREHADRLLAEAERHLASAGTLAADDPQGAFALMYDASRKALTAILANQGLRPTTAGGHRAVYDALCAQFVPPMSATLRPFDRMRRRRAEIEYPDVGTPAVTETDVKRTCPRRAPSWTSPPKFSIRCPRSDHACSRHRQQHSQRPRPQRAGPAREQPSARFRRVPKPG